MESATARIRASDASGEAGRLQATLEVGDRRSQFFFQSRDIQLIPNNEAIVTSALLPCMVTGNDLVIDGPVSRKLLATVPVISDIYHGWHPYLRKVELRNAVPVERERPSNGRVGLFFSGGVDSWYTLLKHRREITDLIFLHGFEIPLEDRRVYERASGLIHRVAEGLAKSVVHVQTNLRPFLAGLGLRWGMLAHGPALVTVGHLLYPHFGRIFISASHTYAELAPWGSHPLLDPMWSTEGLEFVHDGAEATRIDKVRRLAESDLALETLRVCSEGPAALPNCGRCEKCIRTMINLLVVGALDRCRTFEVGLDVRRIAKISIKNESTRGFVQENLSALEQAGDQPHIARALRKALNRSEQRRLWRAVLRDASPTGYQWLGRVYRRLRPAGRRGNPSATVIG